MESDKLDDSQIESPDDIEDDDDVYIDTDDNITHKTCQYVAYPLVPMAIGFGILQILICGLCVLWKMNWCKGKSEDIENDADAVVTVATQTGGDARGSHTYEGLVITDETSSEAPRYMMMPYAVSPQHGYQEIQQPPYEQPETSENPYLELCGYSYLQLQDTTTRVKVERIISPLIVALCREAGPESDQYELVEEKIKQLSQELQKTETLWSFFLFLLTLPFVIQNKLYFYQIYV